MVGFRVALPLHPALSGTHFTIEHCIVSSFLHGMSYFLSQIAHHVHFGAMQICISIVLVCQPVLDQQLLALNMDSPMSTNLLAHQQDYQLACPTTRTLLDCSIVLLRSSFQGQFRDAP